ncbi:anaerobic ribonucleoside-triphosphate reductase activating protein [Pelolinea submarina]|uniref:Pyruvate formate lyase activating enzyme n=1 Tax=Pelolinea submarina TaxID=913107 RepID=A0A347ZP70_9CHLR|nr:anaerobic ribonucleoside-triphosphate reductase activating protein [Pelolinea submarina]REG08702.1 pyruvate formate lyase activating enzyme [Pelolinea submarina]BBB47101.1 pyruvate formate lyase activating enzyme [Pelolinea submarina]
MILGGLQKFSLADYPGKTCAILFTRGCNFRCPYCHNPELVWPERYTQKISMENTLAFLENRRGLLDAVTVTGGEPCLQPDLPDLLVKLKRMGFAVKLDTNGSFPEKLWDVIVGGLVDYVAMDIKAPLAKYARVSAVDLPVEPIRASIALLLEGRVDYEFRTTVDCELLDEEDLLAIGEDIRGARKYYLQKLNAYDAKGVNPALRTQDSDWLQDVALKLGVFVEHCSVR